MGKKKRYRLRAEKFGRKYGLKYGIEEYTNTPVEQAHETLEPAIMAVPDQITEEPVIAQPEPTKIAITAEPAAKPAKKKATSKKNTTTTRKTTRKRATKAKTTT